MSEIRDTATVTITCTRCAARRPAQAAHLDNLLAAGPWECGTCRCEASDG